MESKQELLNNLRNAANKYIKSSDILGEICDNNLNIFGVIAQIQNATYIIENNLNNHEIIPEALIAAHDCLNMELCMRKLENKYKIPVLDTMGFVGDILSADIIGYKSYGKLIC